MELQHVKSVYESIADNFSATRHSQWDWITDFITSKPNDSHILDIGCGNGRNMLYTDYQFTGIDNCQNFVKICQQRDLNVIQSDMTKLPFNDNSFDYIISIASFHHLATVERRKQSLKEMKRVLKHNSTAEILLSVWSINQEHNKKLNFTYGDNMVPWKNRKTGDIEYRYYYIFNNQELKDLIEEEFTIKKWKYNHGNEILVLTC